MSYVEFQRGPLWSFRDDRFRVLGELGWRATIYNLGSWSHSIETRVRRMFYTRARTTSSAIDRVAREVLA